MLYVLKFDFYFLLIKILPSFATVIYPFCFKKQTLELLLYLFKTDLRANGCEDISFLFLKYMDLPKLFRSKVRRKDNFLLYLHSKVIGLRHFELKISNCQSKVHEFIWNCNGVLIQKQI